MKWIFSLVLVLSYLLAIGQEANSVGISNMDLWKSQFGIHFSYPSADMPTDRFLKPNSSLSLEQNLDELAKLLDLEYRIVDNNVLLRSSIVADVPQSELKREYKLSGRIKLEDDTDDLQWIAVSVEGTTLGTFSDEKGYFELIVPNQFEDRLVTIHHLGYEDVQYSIQEMEGQLFVVELKSSNVTLDEVTIISEKKSLSVSEGGYLELDNKENWKLKGAIAGADILRQIQMIPGLNATNDVSVELEVRGAESHQTVVVLDGMPLYRVSHYNGLFSAINSSFVERVRLHKNYFPVQYGGSTAGVLELFSEEDLDSDFSGELEFNLLTGSAHAIVPLSDRISWNIAGRTTWSNVSNSQFYSQTSSFMDSEALEDLELEAELSKSDPEASFSDLNSSLRLLLGKQTQLTFNAFYSQDEMLTDFEKTQVDKKNRQLQTIFLDDESWSNKAGSLVLKTEVDHSFHFNAVAFGSNFNTDYSNLSSISVTTGSNQMSQSTPDNILSMVTHKNSITDLGLITYGQKKWDNTAFRFGASVIDHKLDYNFLDEENTVLRGKDTITEYAIFSNGRFLLSDKLTVEVGLRTEYHTQRDSRLFLSPRTQVRFQHTPALSYKASYGYFQQCIRSINYDFQGISKQLWVGANSEVPVLTSSNFMLGGTWVNKLFTLDLELYRKNLSDMLEFTAINPGGGPRSNSREYSIFRGRGYSHGIDVMMNSTFKNFKTYLCYTLSKSEERYKLIDNGEFFPSENDRRHQLKFLNEYTFKSLTVNLDFIYGSGRPYVDIENIGQNGDIRNMKSDSRFDYLDDFERWDLGLSYDFDLPKVKMVVSAGVLNLFNSENVRYNQTISTSFDDDQGSGSSVPVGIVVGNESRLLTRSYNLSLGISF